MKYFKLLFVCAMAFLFFSAFSFKRVPRPVYAFGISVSFMDTVVYYTDIQILDSAQISDGFLKHRELYSYQLKDYVEAKDLQKNSTCMIYFSRNKKRITKEALGILNDYKNKRSKKIQRIDSVDFKFNNPEE